MCLFGMIHGRFQPFHNGHLQYFKLAFSQVDKLYVGITNPYPHIVQQVHSDNHRHTPEANIFTYLQRYHMIMETVRQEEDLKHRINDIIVFPFNASEIKTWNLELPPKNVIQFVNIIEEWDCVKAECFQKLGYKVINVNIKRLTSGTVVRELFSKKDYFKIEKLVPKGTFKILNNIM